MKVLIMAVFFYREYEKETLDRINYQETLKIDVCMLPRRSYKQDDRIKCLIPRLPSLDFRFNELFSFIVAALFS